MVIKWIVCKVSCDTKDAFSESQAEWTGLKTVDGFFGQVGGWNQNDPLEACIVGFWRDSQAFENFMKYEHDVICEGNGQQVTYHGISVVLYEEVLAIPGAADTLQAALSAGELLRVAESLLDEGRDEHFIEQQRNVWNPGMRRYSEMLGGVFGSKRGEMGQYLTLTVWQNEIAHRRYAETEVATLRERAQVENDLQSITGRIVPLEPRWTVLP